MISILSKPREQISIDDILELIRLRIPESEKIEYKRELSRKKGNVEDDWMSGGSLGNNSKESLVKQAIAFSNTNGGAIILGVDESQDNPPVASQITSVPRCADLANSLTSVLLSRIEPPLLSLEVFPIKCNGECGLVVIRVEKSRQAPHRDKETRKSYVRRNDQSREITMREIQDATLNTARGLENLDRKFAKRDALFQKEFNSLVNPDDVFGIRMSAISVNDNVWIDRVFDQRRIISSLDKPWVDVFDCQEDRHPYKLLPTGSHNPSFPWKPILRGVRGEETKSKIRNQFASNHWSTLPHSILYNEIHCNGLVELGLVAHSDYPNDREGTFSFFVTPDLILSMFANLMTQLHHLRTHAGSPMAEYAVEIIATVMGSPRTIGRPERTIEPVGVFSPGIREFPRYSLTDVDDFSDTLNLFFRDLFNAFGRDLDDAKRSLRIAN